jgi:gliding motility-associated-like protein
MQMRFFKVILPVILITFFMQTAHAQMSVTSARTSGNWADHYVNNVLLGAGVTAFNITFTGCDTTINGVGVDSNQIAEFTSSTPTVQIPYGVLLSTGSSEQAAASSINPPFGPGASDNAGDPDLATIVAPSTPHNRAILEFDFVPQGDSVKFDYVFGSIEYPNFVCSSFNDVFGFFLSGPGIAGPYSNGAVNLAVIPGTTIPVAINTINDVPGGFSCAPPGCPCNSNYFVNNYTAPTDTNNNIPGLTVSLQAQYQVNCGDTYHIKLAIADAGDGALDSYVFLEGGSFSSNVVEVNITSVNGDSTINEGCGQAEIQFFRTDTIDTSYTPLIMVGTATNGLDFTLIPDTIVMLPGQTDTTVVIAPFADGITEGMEYISITAVSINPCGDTFFSTGTLYFFDVPNLSIELLDTTLTCPETDSIGLFANVLSGGPPPYSISWSTGQSGENMNHFPIQTNGYDTVIVSVQDSCALHTLTDTLIYRRNVAGFPLVKGSPDTVVSCEGDTVQLTYTSNFGSGQSTIYWYTNDTLPSVEVVVNSGDIFTVTMVDSCARMMTDTLDITVAEFVPLVASLSNDTVYCPGDSVFLESMISGGVAGFTYSWDSINPVFDDSIFNAFVVQNDSFAIFTFRDACGRTANDSAYLEVQDVDELNIDLADKEVQCDGVRVTLSPIITGGSVPYSYEWSEGTTDRILDIVVSLDQDLTLTVTDFCGRRTTEIAAINTPEFPTLDLLITEDGEVCYGDEFVVEALGIGGAGDYSYDWVLPTGFDTDASVERLDSNSFLVMARTSGMHQVRVTDFCGNVFSDSLRITVNPCVFIPNVITPNGDEVNDYFEISNIESFFEARLSVYNRWGEKVFESKNYQNDWSPAELASGTYYYVLTSDEFPEYRGDVTIISGQD